MTDLSKYQTPEPLLKALRETAGRKLSQSETFEQQVSFVYGSLDSNSNMTKQQVRDMLSRGTGTAA